MTGVVGALVALAVVVALVLVLAVRPHVRRLTRSVAVSAPTRPPGWRSCGRSGHAAPHALQRCETAGLTRQGSGWMVRRGLSPLPPHLRRALPPPLGAPDVTAGPTPRRRLRSD